MAYQKQPNKGFFGKNRNRKNEKSPTHTGNLLIGDDTLAALNQMKAEGKALTLYVSGWENVPQGGGEKYFSIVCNTPQGQGSAGTPPPPVRRTPATKPPQEDDIPF